ncbi:MAG TPA: proline dehydrogenase family protein [Phycisphaerae bacterium]|nr:proline dehydrogenase family protein [Phycisphaerae bacterium]
MPRHPVPSAPPADRAPDLEARTRQIGRELLAASRASPDSALSRKFWSDKLLAFALQNDRFKNELFRFIDVFPSLKTPAAINQHLHEYLLRPDLDLPPGLAFALNAGNLLKSAQAAALTAQVQSMARTFIAGHSLEDALPTLAARWSQSIAFSVDLLGEAVVSHAEAAAYRARYDHLLDTLPAAVAQWPANPILDTDHLGPIPRANLSIKISALDGHVTPIDTDTPGGSLDRLTDALAPLLQKAARNNVFINFDMESHALHDLTLRLFKRCCERFDFPAGLALQSYLRSIHEDAADLIAWSRSINRRVTIRLIKGAYWDYETIHAQMMNWPVPVWPRKEITDAAFENAADLFLQNTPRRPGDGGITLAVGTHNTRSVARTLALLEAHNLPPNAIEFQALRGMADDLKLALAARHLRIREYVPVGELIPGMAYLVRRLLENTSNTGWLHADTSRAPDDVLLASPHIDEPAPATPREPPAFQNEPLRNFSLPEVRAAFANALARSRLQTIENTTTLDSADTMVQSAADAYPAWRDTPVDTRAALIEKAAARIAENRDALAALIIQESHKTWPEADADVCEAIDFCRYYALHASLLQNPHPTGPALTGERNDLRHLPRGPTAVIAPWNFPLSIATGMTVAALVTGNPVILKPAEQTPAIAAVLVHHLHAAGIPKNVLHFCPAPGETVGAALVRHPLITTIAFTGSKSVGLDILRAAADTPPNAPFIKRVVCEMGGKNAMIVDDSADIDDAVLAVRHSAFSYAGQKCSAGSRLILLDAIHDAFLTRLIEATRALILGDPQNPSTDLGPVIDAEAAKKIRHYIDIGQQEATLAYPNNCPLPIAGCQSELNPNRQLAIDNGQFIPPHLFTNVPPESRLATDEIFGPVLAVLRAKDFPHALRLANLSAYKLTGGLFSRTPSHIAAARTHFLVGNLYINRSITGALVERQPFGGFGLSGTGSKAGGPHYLLHFTDPQAISESTLRHGFAPEVPSDD